MDLCQVHQSNDFIICYWACYARIKTDKNLNISADSQLICTKLSEQGLLFWAGRNESKKCYARSKTYKNLIISADSQLICTKLSEQGLFSEPVKMSPRSPMLYMLCYTDKEKVNFSSVFSMELENITSSVPLSTNTETKMDLIQMAYYPADSCAIRPSFRHFQDTRILTRTTPLFTSSNKPLVWVSCVYSKAALSAGKTAFRVSLKTLLKWSVCNTEVQRYWFTMLNNMLLSGIREQWHYNSWHQEVVTPIHVVKIKTIFCKTPWILTHTT